MNKPSWFERSKETFRVTWPVQIIGIMLSILILLNIIYSYTHYTQDSDALRFSNVINGLLVASTILLIGVDFLYYKDHYQQMAAKYNMPGYERQIKYAKFYILGGMSLIIANVVIWFVFY